MERGGEDYREYKKAVKKAKEAIETICELTEDMEEQYGERSSSRMRSGYPRKDDWDDMEERSMSRRRM
jgi:hypothetical protein